MQLQPRPVPRRLPVLPVGGAVVFPGALGTLELTSAWVEGPLGRVDAADPLCLAMPLRTPSREPEPDAWSSVAVLARVVSVVRLPEGIVRIALQGIARVAPEAPRLEEGVWTARGHALDEEPSGALHGREALERLFDRLRTLADTDPRYGPELVDLLGENGSDPGRQADMAASLLPLNFAQRSALLVEADPTERLALLNEMLATELIRSRAGRELELKVAQRIRRDYLREKLEALRAELDEPDPHAAEALRLEAALEATPLSPSARREAQRELALFRRSPPTSPEAVRIRSYLEWMLELPWRRGRARRAPRRFEPVVNALQRSHVGLADVKQRIVEYLAVRKLGGGARGTVLCFVGPPGTGKSSMGRALATALRRPFASIPVGGMTSEGEITGVSHKTEAGAPGAILAAVHRAGSRDPVLLLDEIDKLRLGAEGESSGALLQLLDPEQNADYQDDYLGVPFDVSECLFVATANDVEDMPEALLDRMEIIEFSGYTEAEKMAIARNHLLPRALDHAGLRKEEFSISPGALRTIVRGYTEEAGVRQLQRELMTLARKAAVSVVQQGVGLRIRQRDLARHLGPVRTEEDMRLTRPAVGVATGLAWTNVGGSLLPIEALGMPGSGNLILTGRVGEVLRESVQTVISYVRHAWRELGLDQEPLEGIDLHLHFPSGATPKDGPSAGVAIATALVSLLSGRRARHDVASTGEVSLRGAVLPVGGLREKCLAALRNGVRTVVLPERNADEVRRLPKEVRERLEVVAVRSVHEAVACGLVGGLRLRRPAASGERRRNGSVRRGA